MKQKMYSRKLRQLKFRTKQLNRLVESGGFEELSLSRKRTLLAKIQKLYRSLAAVFGSKKLRPILAGAAFVASMAATPMQAQQFAPSVLNPYGLTPSGAYFNFIAAADMDNDGDLDIIECGLPDNIYPATFQFYENIGTDTNPEYAEPVENPFGLTPAFSDIAVTLGDVDGDGDYDMITGAGYSASFNYYENMGTPEVPEFGAADVNPFGLTSLYYYNFPVLADIDSDGDLDLFASDYFSTYKFFENIGSAMAPEFLEPVNNAFNLEGGEGLLVGSFGDLDNDGDLDLIHADYNYGGVFLSFQENVGTSEVPDFGGIEQNPFGLSVGYYLPFPIMMDMDGDGDQDILGGSNYYGNMPYFENVATWAQAADSEVTMGENGAYFFAESDFNFDGSGGDFLGAIRIQSLPQVGVLTFGGNPVELNQVIFPDELASLSFSPLQDEFGDPYDNFDFKVINQDGVYNIGNYTMTIVVAEVSAVSEPLEGATVKLFPNPASTEINLDLEFENAPTGIRLELSDLLGRSIMVKDLPGNQKMQESLSLNGLASGAYFVRIIADEQAATYTFNKQ